MALVGPSNAYIHVVLRTSYIISNLVSRPCKRHVDKEGSYAAKTQYTRHISYDPVVSDRKSVV